MANRFSRKYHFQLSASANRRHTTKMKFFLVLCAIVATAVADVSHLSSSYLPPVRSSQQQYSVAASAPAVSYSAPAQQSYQVAASAPAVSYAAPAVNYGATVASAPAVSYSAPAQQSYQVAASAPAVSYSAPAVSYSAPAVSYSAPAQQTYQVAASAPAVSYSAPTVSYSAPAQQTYQVAASAPAVSYAAPVAAAAPAVSYSAPAVSYSAPAQQTYQVAASAPAVSYSAPAEQTYQTQSVAAPAPAAEYQSYETAASEPEPAHTFSATDGYSYKTNRRVVVRHRRRRDVSHLPSTEYLPPVRQAAASVPAPSSEYLPPQRNTYSVAASAPVAVQTAAPAVSYSAPVEQSYEVASSAPVAQVASYETAESAPAHTFSSNDGYRYKTNRRVVLRRHRRDVSHLPSSEYLPPVQTSYAASESVPVYQSVAESAPAVSYAAPQAQQSYETASYETAESAPAHSYSSNDGYRYKTNRRVVLRRHRRDVSHLPSSEYLPPVRQAAASVPAPSSEYLPPQRSSYSVAASAPVAQTVAAPAAPAVSYSAPAQQSYEVAASAPVAQVAQVASYETAESAPAHTFSSNDGYRYKTNRRVVLRRHRRDVSHLPSSEYLPPVQTSYAASAPAPVYQAAPAVSYAAAPVQQQSYEVAASAPSVSYDADYSEAAPAHSYSANDGYRYKTSRRRVFRRRN